MSSSLNQLWCTLVTANHIRDYFSLVTGYGHISARNPLTNTTFLFDPVDPPSLINSNAGYLEWNISNGTSQMELTSATNLLSCRPARKFGFTKPSTRDIQVSTVLSTATPGRSYHSRIPTSLFCPSLTWKPCLIAESRSLISLTTTPQTSPTTSLFTFRTWVQHWQIPSPHPSTM
jgi:hypothetical protein